MYYKVVVRVQIRVANTRDAFSGMFVLGEFQRSKEKSEWIDTGEPSLDNELAYIHGITGSGVPVHSFTEFSGYPGVGKTAICLCLAREVLLRGQRVLFLSCNYSQFPLERARRLANWKRARFESRIDEVFIKSLEQLLVLELDWEQYRLIIVERYDGLVKRFWDSGAKRRAYQAILNRLQPLKQHSCVIATCGGEAYHFPEEQNVVVAPSSWCATVGGVVRLSLYKNDRGDSVLSTGLAFRIDDNGLAPSSCGRARVEVPLPCLTTKKSTPLKRRLNFQRVSPSSPKRLRSDITMSSEPEPPLDSSIDSLHTIPSSPEEGPRADLTCMNLPPRSKSSHHAMTTGHTLAHIPDWDEAPLVIQSMEGTNYIPNSQDDSP